MIRLPTLACCIGLGLVLAPGFVVPGFAAAPSTASSAKEDLRRLKARIDAVQQRLAEAEEKKTDAADALRDSERAISDANRALAQLTEASREANARLAELKREVARTEVEMKAQQEALARLLYQQYAAGRPETLSILLNGGDPNAVARELHYLTYIGRARSELVSRLRATLANLRDLTREAEAQAAELAVITAEQAAQRRRLELEKRARAQVFMRASREISQRRREIGTLKRDESRLTRLVEQLAKVVARTPQARAAPEPRIRNERVPERGRDDGPFAQLKGRLALPVRGELGNRFGSPREDGGVVWKGLLIAAATGEEVRAVAGGRVVFADWLRGFGNLLIIDHGDGYMSLYGYNETLFKQVGDVIRGGERVAAVGNSGGYPESGLYFELRHEGRPFDPLTWVNVR